MARKKSVVFVISTILVLVALIFCIVGESNPIDSPYKFTISFVAIFANIVQIFAYFKESSDLTDSKETLLNLQKKLDEIEKTDFDKMTPVDRVDRILSKLKELRKTEN